MQAKERKCVLTRLVQVNALKCPSPQCTIFYLPSVLHGTRLMVWLMSKFGLVDKWLELSSISDLAREIEIFGRMFFISEE